MTECDEIAEAMLLNYQNWLWHKSAARTLTAAREFVDMQMPGEGVTIRENVAYALYRLSGRVKA